MSINPTITQDEISILEWLSREDSSALGECQGAILDSLKAKGFATWDESTQPPNLKEYCRVSVTDLGWSILKQDRSTIHPHA